MNAEEWNKRFPIGTPIRYWPGVREGKGRASATRSLAWELGNGEPMVSVKGYPGGIALSHVEPVLAPNGKELDGTPASLEAAISAAEQVGWDPVRMESIAWHLERMGDLMRLGGTGPEVGKAFRADLAEIGFPAPAGRGA